MRRPPVCRLIFTFIGCESSSSNTHLCNKTGLLDFTLTHPITDRTTRLLELSEHTEPPTWKVQNYCLKVQPSQPHAQTGRFRRVWFNRPEISGFPGETLK